MTFWTAVALSLAFGTVADHETSTVWKVVYRLADISFAVVALVLLIKGW